jgi:hypothetical protein
LAQNGPFPPIFRSKNAHYALHNVLFCASTRLKCAHFDYNPKFKGSSWVSSGASKRIGCGHQVPRLFLSDDLRMTTYEVALRLKICGAASHLFYDSSFPNKIAQSILLHH